MPSLYLTTPGARLELESGQLVCVIQQEVLLAVPAARVDQVVIVGGAHITTPALAFMLDRGIDLVFLTASGAFRGRLDTGQNESIAVRCEQYRRAGDNVFCLDIGRAIVRGKIRNCRTRCMELDTENDPAAIAAIARLQQAMEDVGRASSLSELMGIEGRAARSYFSVLRRHLREPWVFPARARRPPPDPVNALLSIVYTLLHESCRSALVVAGLDPACGFLHQPRPGRSSLAVDLIEEFRPVIADTVVWALLNNRMVSPADFAPDNDGSGIRLQPDGWRAVARQYSRRMERPIRVPGRTTRTTYRKLLEIQARQLRRVIMGEQDRYEPFASR